VQPSPVRLEYLERVLAAYQERYGGLPPADFWFIHAFVLNEVPGEWGAGMPVDHASRPYAAEPEVVAPEAVDDLAQFTRRVESFRQWMAEHRQRDQPLWITEYGVLMPSNDEFGFFAISEAKTQAFMLGSFDYLRSAADPTTGLPTDNDRLVQRWFWWTLSYDARVSGGGLYDRRDSAITQTVLYDAYAAASDCH
jgi:hypothetical protein